LFSRTVENDDVLSRLRVPALVTHGEEDRFVRTEADRHHAGAIPDARLSLYTRVGHAPQWEDATRFNRELRELAAALPSST
jgi:non-heme chloroperoxidase